MYLQTLYNSYYNTCTLYRHAIMPKKLGALLVSCSLVCVFNMRLLHVFPDTLNIVLVQCYLFVHHLLCFFLRPTNHLLTFAYHPPPEEAITAPVVLSKATERRQESVRSSTEVHAPEGSERPRGPIRRLLFNRSFERMMT